MGDTYGGRGEILDTTAAGGRWRAAGAPSAAGGIYGISCPSSTTCTSFGGGFPDSAHYFLSTADSGRSWGLHAMPSGVSVLGGVSCPSQRICYAAGAGTNGVGGLVIAGRPSSG